MKRILVVLAAVLVLATAFAAVASADTFVDKVEIIVTAPVAGAKPDFTATPKNGCCIVGDPIDWVDESDGANGRLLEASDVFVAGHVYTVYVPITAQKGETIDAKKTVFTINGKTAKGGVLSDTWLEAGFTFDALGGQNKTLVEKVDITVAAPAVGDKPSFTYKAAGNGYAVDEVTWADYDENRYLNDSDVFKAGHDYVLGIDMSAADGFEFDKDKTVYLLNGQKATVLERDSKPAYTRIYINYLDLAGAKLIEKADITVTAPKAGEKAVFTAKVAGDGVTFQNMAWGDDQEMEFLTEGDTFKAGRPYSTTVMLKAAEGYAFDESKTAFTINGQKASVFALNESEASVYVSFPALEGGEAFNGFKQLDDGLYYYTNGRIDESVNGLKLDDVKNAFYFCANGRVATEHTGIAIYDGQFFYVVSGMLDVDRTGIITYDGERFIIAAGRILIEYNGLIQDPVSGKWYFVAAGQVVNYTGLALYDGAWFYVIDGELGVNFSGEVEYDGAKFNVVNGMLAS